MFLFMCITSYKNMSTYGMNIGNFYAKPRYTYVVKLSDAHPQVTNIFMP